jgi:hypothetical protein
MLRSETHDYVSCGDKSLFVGQRYGLSGLYSSYRRLQSAETDHRCENDVDVLTLYKVTHGFHSGKYLYIMWLQGIRNLAVLVRVAYYSAIGIELDGLPDE